MIQSCLECPSDRIYNNIFYSHRLSSSSIAQNQCFSSTDGWVIRYFIKAVLLYRQQLIIIKPTKMNKQLPVVNRLLHRKDLERSNELLMHKLMTLKFSNISSLNSPSPDKRIPKVRHIDLVKITVSSDKKQRRVKTLLGGERIKEENKVLFSRLVNQKSTMQAKNLAEQRHRNVEYLKRIGRYPYVRVKSVASHLESGDGSTPLKSEFRRYQTEHYHEEDESQIYNVRAETQKSKNLNWQLGEEQKKDHLIVLFSKVIQISKNWFTVKVLRFKNHYQFKLQSYPYQKVQYSLKLPEDIGTAVLTQNDYDYLHICERYIKMTHQYVCFSFQITAEEKKKYFYRFQKRVLPATGEEEKEEVLSQVQEQRIEEESPTALRKTMFAVENEKKEKEQLEASQRKFKSSHDKEIQEKQSRLDISGSIDIRLSGIFA